MCMQVCNRLVDVNRGVQPTATHSCMLCPCPPMLTAFQAEVDVPLPLAARCCSCRALASSSDSFCVRGLAGAHERNCNAKVDGFLIIQALACRASQIHPHNCTRKARGTVAVTGQRCKLFEGVRQQHAYPQAPHRHIPFRSAIAHEAQRCVCAAECWIKAAKRTLGSGAGLLLVLAFAAFACQ